KYRARFVAQGFGQTRGVDYHETFSPVVSVAALRMIIAMATAKGWTIRQRDVVLAYLNGKLQEEIYLEQPEEFKHGDAVCRLHRALYGLKQNGRGWNHELHKELLHLGFTQLPTEPCIYVLRTDQAITLIMAVYVDDILLTGPDTKVIKKFEELLAQKFKMFEGGDLCYKAVSAAAAVSAAVAESAAAAAAKSAAADDGGERPAKSAAAAVSAAAAERTAAVKVSLGSDERPAGELRQRTSR
ncbi:MAG: reverse transcriptase (RNA-dependent DNA polymerase)-domain-containing protein, partial [Olpidium bornovanus]